MIKCSVVALCVDATASLGEELYFFAAVVDQLHIACLEV